MGNPITLTQTAIIDLLKTRLPPNTSGLVTATEIREAEWKGTAFTLPNVRVARGQFQPDGNGNCTDRRWRVLFRVSAFSKKDSSVLAQLIQEGIITALDGYRLSNLQLRSLPIRLVSTTPAEPEGEVWRASANFRTIVNLV